MVFALKGCYAECTTWIGIPETMESRPALMKGRLFCLFCCFLAVMTAACSSGSSGMGGSPPDTQAIVESVLGEAVLPLINQMEQQLDGVVSKVM